MWYVWYIIGILNSSPTDFHSEKIWLIRVTEDPPVNICLFLYLSFFLSLFLSLSVFLSLPLSLYDSFFIIVCLELDFKAISDFVFVNPPYSQTLNNWNIFAIFLVASLCHPFNSERVPKNLWFTLLYIRTL